MLIKEVIPFFFLCLGQGHAYVSKYGYYEPSMENGRLSHKHKHSHTARSPALLFANYSNADGISPLMHMVLKESPPFLGKSNYTKPKHSIKHVILWLNSLALMQFEEIQAVTGNVMD